jgi:hypothetical protein
MRSLIKALVATSLLLTSGVAFAQPNQFGAGGAKIVVPAVTSDAYTIPLDYASPGIILANTADADADVWTLPDCDSAISMGDAPYGPKYSTVGAVVQVANTVGAAATISLSPIATDMIGQLTGAVDVDISSTVKGGFVSLTCVADDLWLPTVNFGFDGSTTINAFQSPNGVRAEQAKAATDTTIGVLEIGPFNVLTSTGASGAIEITLPDCTGAVLGEVAVVQATAQAISVLPGDESNTLFILNGLSLDAGDEVDLAVGGVVEFQCSATDRWNAVGGGTDGGAT